MVQLTVTFTTLAETLPLPLVTVQVWPEGWPDTVTAYSPPEAIGVPKVKAPFAVTVFASVPLFCKVTVLPAVSPFTNPLTVYVTGGLLVQITEMEVTLALAIPDPPATAHVFPVGSAPPSVTANGAPFGTGAENAKAEFPETVRALAPLFSKTRL